MPFEALDVIVLRTFSFLYDGSCADSDAKAQPPVHSLVEVDSKGTAASAPLDPHDKMMHSCSFRHGNEHDTPQERQTLEMKPFRVSFCVKLSCWEKPRLQHVGMVIGIKSPPSDCKDCGCYRFQRIIVGSAQGVCCNQRHATAILQLRNYPCYICAADLTDVHTTTQEDKLITATLADGVFVDTVVTD